MAREDLRLILTSRRRSRAALLAAAIGFGNVACNQRAIESWLSEGQQNAGPSLYTEEPFRKLVLEVKRAVPAPIQVLSLLVYPDHAVLQVMDPGNHSRALQYVYRGGALSDGVPVKLLGKGKLEDNVFPLEAAKIAAIPHLTRDAQNRAKIPEGSVARVLLKRNLPESMDIQFRVFVTSQRRDAFFDANQDGVLID
ncbi:MAG TPA: hypothetical protein VHE30_30465 [Polyangiaceae bacterium]|nr:hypothetical protein [Polyangiaceae bacterium]